MKKKLPITIKLEFPFKVDKTVVNEVTISKLNAWTCRHLRVGADISEEEMVLTVARAAGVEEHVIDEMDPVDFRAVKEVVVSLLRDEEQSDEDESNALKAVNLPHILTLKDPFKLGPKQYKDVTFSRRLIMRFTKQMRPELFYEDFLMLVACMTGLTQTEVGEFSVRDFIRCTEVVFPFWLGGRETKNTAE